MLKQNIKDVKTDALSLLISQILLNSGEFIMKANIQTVAQILFNITEFVLQRNPTNVINAEKSVSKNNLECT